MRRMMLLAATLVAGMALGLTQTVAGAGTIKDPCASDSMIPLLVSDGGLSNTARQCNSNLSQQSSNTAVAVVPNANDPTVSPQSTVQGSNTEENDQSNKGKVNQEQETNGAQVNFLRQSIVGWVPATVPVFNDADQSNQGLSQGVMNTPVAAVANSNPDASPQSTVLGDNSQRNDQSNRTYVDQEQETNGAQVNALSQSIVEETPPKVDPSNDADQSNQDLSQHALNAPVASIANSNVDTSPQTTVVGNNSQENEQTNK